MRNYKKSAEEIVRFLGDDENILNVSHCATRLRFVVKDKKCVDLENLKRVISVITVVESAGQIQVVIGNHVSEVYNHVLSFLSPLQKSESASQKIGIFSQLIDIISSIFAPFLYPLAACGILQGMISLLASFDLMNRSSGTYQILDMISWTGFTFLPVLVAMNAAKKFNVNPYSAIISACALISPAYLGFFKANEILSLNSADPATQTLMKKVIENPELNLAFQKLAGIPLHLPKLDFLGIPIQYLSYTSSVIPIILMVWIMSFIQPFFEKRLPSVIRNLFTPLFSIGLTVPLTLLIVGPFGYLIGSALSGAYNFLYELSPIIAGFVVGSLWQGLVTFGVHWGITPVVIGNLADLGFDTFTALQASAVFAMAGAVFGVFFKTKNKEMKGISLSAGITALFGITEPAIYGVALRLKRPFICACFAGGIGGTIAGAFNSVVWSYCFPGIAVLPVFFKEGHLIQFIGFLISIVVAFSLGAIFTYFSNFEKIENEPEKEKNETQKNEKNDSFSPIQTKEIFAKQEKTFD